MSPSPRTPGSLSPSRAATQARSAAQAVVWVMARCLGQHRPADRCLHDYCTQNHQLGARDRRIISETLFSVLRWWGWLQKLAPQRFLEAWKEGAQDLPDHTDGWEALLAAAWVLENRFDFPPAVMAWLRSAELYPELFQGLPADIPVAERRRNLRPFFRSQAMPPLSLEELLPPWLPRELTPLPSDIPFSTLVEWLQKRPPVWLRCQEEDPRAEATLPLRLAQEFPQSPLRLAPHPKLPHAFCLRYTGANLRGTQAFREGRFEVQDLASQAVGFVCAPRPGQQWWDACAGGGGKSLQLAYLMKNRGVVEATDLRTTKLEELKLRARRGGFSNIRLREWQGTHTPEAYRDRFDGVLVDTPCSCAGTWRRTPDGRWNTTEESLQEFSRLQRQILEAAAPAVKPGGTLVYSTCSMLKAENQDVVDAFLDAHPQFILTPHIDPVTGKTCLGMTKHWPWDGDCDAMFTAKMTRRKQ